jgi:ferritin-like metal-binding protein YciE
MANEDKRFYVASSGMTRHRLFRLPAASRTLRQAVLYCPFPLLQICENIQLPLRHSFYGMCVNKIYVMEKLTDLRALLVHEVKDVYSAEEQILTALPKMIDKASNSQLKKALQDHFRTTRNQKQRLDKVQQLLKVGEEEKGAGKKSGILGLFGTSEKCKGMQGIIHEGEKIMNEDIDTEVLDAAIIASCQKIEHYEICAYGTVKAYAQELGLTQVVKLLDETLAEEYEADVLLTEIAVFGGLNRKAETAEPESRTSRSGAESRGSSRERSSATSSSRSASSPGRSSAAKKSSTASSKSSASLKSSSSKGTSSAKKSNASKTKKKASARR